MLVANSNSGMRINLTPEDYELFTDGGKANSLYVSLAPRSIQAFLSISRKEIPHSERFSVLRNVSKATPHMVTLDRKVFTSQTKNLPKFAPEPVAITPQNTHEGVVWHVMRPPMKRPINGGRRPIDWATAQTKHKRQLAFDKPPVEALPSAEVAPAPVNGAGLPYVAPAPDKGLMTEAARIGNMRVAVNTLNAFKREYGERAVFKIMENGELRVLVEYGATEVEE